MARGGSSTLASSYGLHSAFAATHHYELGLTPAQICSPAWRLASHWSVRR